MNNLNINAHCAICGQGYHVCNSCLEQKSFKPWRSIVDSIDHYRIYLAIHGYTTSKDKNKAKLELQKCDLSDLDNFRTEIKNVINEILETDNKNVSISKKKRKNNTEIKVNDVNE